MIDGLTRENTRFYSVHVGDAPIPQDAFATFADNPQDKTAFGLLFSFFDKYAEYSKDSNQNDELRFTDLHRQILNRGSDIGNTVCRGILQINGSPDTSRPSLLTLTSQQIAEPRSDGFRTTRTDISIGHGTVSSSEELVSFTEITRMTNRYEWKKKYSSSTHIKKRHLRNASNDPIYVMQHDFLVPLDRSYRKVNQLTV